MCHFQLPPILTSSQEKKKKKIQRSTPRITWIYLQSNPIQIFSTNYHWTGSHSLKKRRDYKIQFSTSFTIPLLARRVGTRFGRRLLLCSHRFHSSSSVRHRVRDGGYKNIVNPRRHAKTTES